MALAGCAPLEQSEKSEKASADYPTGYIHWHKVAGPLRRGSQYRTIYANDLAYARTGKEFPVGTVLVREDRQVVIANGVETMGPPTDILVMRKVGPAAPDTGGWSFEAYDPTTKKHSAKDTTGCIACHIPFAKNDYVHSNLPISSPAQLKK